MIRLYAVGALLCSFIPLLFASPADQTKKEKIMSNNHIIYQQKLENGMTVLVSPTHAIPKVSIQLWYNVGSKDEKTGEKGIAHLIEHMIFKGTSGKESLNLSETDINMITHMLSGSCNAFTGHDYTGYLFNFPTHTWKHALPIMADCMVNCAFKEDHLNSEMKAVIQELKMRRDNYVLSLAESMITAIFSEHPYHYPIIGYKQDLWNVHGKDLKAFYKKHYVPNNATLVVVGDVDPEEVFELADQYFGSIPANPHYKKDAFYINHDIASKSITLYRDIQRPQALVAFLVPGSQEKKDHVLEFISWILGQGKGSRLYKKLVDEQHRATTLETFVWHFFEHSLFFVAFEPTNVENVDEIIGTIQEEIQDIVRNGLTQQELVRAIKKARMAQYLTLEDTQQHAYEIGKAFLATGDAHYSQVLLQETFPGIEKEIKSLLALFRPSIMHKGIILPLPEQEKAAWQTLQQESDALDAEILALRARDSELEKPYHLSSIQLDEPASFNFPQATIKTLSNGLKLFSYNNQATPKIDLILEFKARPYYDSVEKPGLYTFMAEMLSEGTQKYSAAQLADELESRGMSLTIAPGIITLSMLSSDLPKGLELLREIVERATFPEKEIEKVRTQLQAAVHNFWDDPKKFSGQLIKDYVYKGHPYSKNLLGTQESIASITRKDLIDFYKKYSSPYGARLAIVGDVQNYALVDQLEKAIGGWQGPVVENFDFPELSERAATAINYPINRDQTVLCFVGLSVDRMHPDYDKFLIFDQIFGGGALGSLHSRLFKIREQTGLFYTINGSLVAQSNEQPGMVLVKTLVSNDRLSEAEQVIKKTMHAAADSISDDEYEEAVNALTNSLALNFESNQGTAAAFLFLDRYDFPADYFNNRAAQLRSISKEEVQQAAQEMLHNVPLLTLRVGRFNGCADQQQ